MALADHFAELAATSDIKVALTAHICAENTRRRAHDIFGDPQKLQTLAESTQAERERLGYPANEPLVRTGELRDSLKVEAEGPIAVVGSELEMMAWHEFGTSRTPSRPVLGIATTEASAENGAVILAGAQAIATGDERELMAAAVVLEGESG